MYGRLPRQHRRRHCGCGWNGGVVVDGDGVLQERGNVCGLFAMGERSVWVHEEIAAAGVYCELGGCLQQ